MPKESWQSIPLPSILLPNNPPPPAPIRVRRCQRIGKGMDAKGIMAKHSFAIHSFAKNFAALCTMMQNI
jgi:hypothetical protein